MNRSLLDIVASALVVSQFTLATGISRDNRPGFSYAAKAENEKRLYEYFASQLQSKDVPVANGSFGADLKVRLINDGPATCWLDTTKP